MIKTKATPLHIAATLLMLMACFIPAKAVTLNSTDFPDANFRAALTQITGVAENGTFDATAITTLDVTGKGITDMTGIANFTELTELILDDNDLSHLILSSNTKLKKLSIRNNDRIIGFSGTTATASNHYINLSKTVVTPIEEFDASESAAFAWFSAIYSSYNVTTVKKAVFKNCPSLDGYPSGLSAQTDLVYLDFTNTKQVDSKSSPKATEGLNYSGSLPKLTNLETLILANNPSLTYADVSSCTKLKYLDVSGINMTLSTQASKLPASIETFIAKSAKASSTGDIENLEKLETVDLSGNSFTSQTIKACPALKTVDVSSNTSITTLSITNSALTALPTITADGCTKLAKLVLDNNQLNEVPVVNIPSVKSMSLTNNNFPETYSLSGCAYENLNLSNNGLKSLSLTNGVLKEISLSGNVGLETLNLSNNGSLQYVNVSGLNELKEFNMAGNDMYWDTQTNSTNKLTAANCPKLEVLILDNARIETAPTINGFQNLKTLSVGGSSNTFTKGTNVKLTNCPAIENINVSGAANVTTITVTNSNLSTFPTITADGCPKLETLEFGNNQLSEVPNISLPTVKYLSMTNNNVQECSLDGSTLQGLDLSNNKLTSLTVENSAMSALALGGNTGLTEVHLHGNANLKKTASATGISAAQGLYIKNLSSLKVLDIENSSFEELGQSNSTDGCTGLETLKAANNKFTTFSNAYKTFGSQGDNGYRPATPTRSSLEHLTGLKYLDLSNNLLQDSLHLYKNTLLETLIVRNNRTIDRYDNLTDYLANTKVRNGLSVNSGKGKAFLEPNDIGAYNDTTGLRMLNLVYNKELKYLDISYTAIHHFARDGRFDGYKEDYYVANFATKATETVKNREPHYLIVTNCNKLVEFYADYNGMKSAAFIKNFEGHNFPYLKRISMIETRGQDSYTMQGSWNPNGKDGCPNVEYINVANSDLDSVGVTKLPHLKYLNVSGNWTKNNWSHWSSTGVGHTLNLKANGELVECVADDCPHLVIAQANDKTNLTSLSLNNNPELKQVYVPNTGLARINGDAYGHPDPNPDTRTQQAVGGLGLAGLNTATNLELLYCEDNSNLTSLDVTANSNLKYLHAYNNAYGADGLNLSQNNNIVTAWVSNSDLTSLQLNGAVALDTLKCQDNAALAALDVRASGDMRYLDLARCHVKDLDVTANTKLEHFDCSNNDKCDGNQGNWISDLYFTSQALKTVVANNNDLYNITLPATLPSLTRMEFAHNHINGIDLSGATSLASEAIVDADNGRTITAECTSSLKGGGNVYYFQLADNAGSQGGKFLSLKPSVNDLKGDMRVSLANDNFDLANLNTWSSGVSGIITGSRQALGAGSLQSDMVYGKIAVLIPSQESTSSASGQAEYTYDNGRSTSTFYLNWSSNGIVTAVDDLNADQQVENVTYYNLAGQPSSEMHDGVNIVVTTLKDGTTLTTKVMK